MSILIEFGALLLLDCVDNFAVRFLLQRLNDWNLEFMESMLHIVSSVK